jgi:SPP1 gp7 family putative phage head morphogenesis protein
MPDNPLLAAIAKYRNRLDVVSERDLQRLISAYTSLAGRLKDKIDLLMLELEKAGIETLTAGQVAKMSRFTQLISAIEAELAKYNIYLETELSQIAKAAMSQAILDSRALIRMTAGNVGITGSFNSLNTGAIATITRLLAPDSPLFKRLQELAPEMAAQISRKILEGVGLGYGYEKLGRMIVDDLGLGLSDALRWARTTQMTAYRETSHATMAENSNVIDGWTWWAQVDDATCDSCRDNHGSFHPAGDSLNDLTAHIWNCRCVELPHVIGDDNPVTGEPIEGD